MTLTALDWGIVALSITVCFVPALFFGRRSGKGTSEFFASGRAVPWWLAGLSMVATTFSSDTPNLVTNLVRTQGVAGNWQWWALVLTGVATVFFFARLWRRSGVLTDLEFYEIRYSGKAASVVRGFRAVYLGLLFNCFIMASVNLAAVKIANVLFGLKDWQTLVFVGLLNVAFAAHSGLWGVMVIDMIQFFIKMTAVIAAAYFAVQAVGGLDSMVVRVSELSGPVDHPAGLRYLDMLPSFDTTSDVLWPIAIAVFVMPLAVNWWAAWYPGGEPGGGSYIAQRMLASKSEKDALAGVLFFNVAHYVLRPWPWILVGLCSLLVFPTLDSIQQAFPGLDKRWLDHDMAYPAMVCKVMPAGWIGLMVAGLIAANSSTILTHLNWGASYLVHDFYRRFVQPGASERHYVMAGRLATIGLFFCAAGMTYLMTSAKANFEIMIMVGAGTGLLYMLRWFWWRINAWCEVVAMLSSFAISILWLLLKRYEVGHLAIGEYALPLTANAQLLMTVAFTTTCWLLTAFLAPQTDMETLIAFYRKVRPFGPGWAKVRRAAGISDAEAKAAAAESGENIPLALLGWVSGCTAIWSSLFTVGNFLYGRTGPAMVLLGVFAVSGLVLIQVVRRLWR